MPLTRLTPTVRDLGILRLWRDDLAEIVALVRQVSNVRIQIEADHYRLDDVDTELAKIGRNLSYITIKALEPDTVTPELLSIRLAKDGCRVEARNPSTELKGIISDIEAIARRCRRLASPLWRIARTRSSPAGDGFTPNPLLIVMVIFSVVWSVLTGISIAQHINHVPVKQLIISWPGSIISGPIVFVAGIVALWLLSQSRTVIYTGTRNDAPTFWQRYRGDLAINAGVGIVFYLLGLLTGHL